MATADEGTVRRQVLVCLAARFGDSIPSVLFSLPKLLSSLFHIGKGKACFAIILIDSAACLCLRLFEGRGSP